MKTIISVILLASVVTFSTVSAEDPNLMWVGARGDDGFKMSFGYGRDLGETPVFGGHTWLMTGTNVGSESSWDILEVALVFSPIANMYVGPLAGPNVDWVDTQPQSGLAYLSGAAGGLLCYDVSEDVGLWGYSKFNYTFEADNLYRDGWQGGGGLYVRF